MLDVEHDLLTLCDECQMWSMICLLFMTNIRCGAWSAYCSWWML